MANRRPLKPTLKIYTEPEGAFIQAPSAQALALCKHLREQGVRVQFPRAVTMETHSLELPAESDVRAVQVLIDDWARQEIAPLPRIAPETTAGKPSRATMFGVE